MRKRLPLLALIVATGFLCAHPTEAKDDDAPKAKPGDVISWAKDLPTAFARAQETQRPLMICVNAKFVRGRQRAEPAAKSLREVIYKDVRVVQKSRGFVCALLTTAGSSADYGELRALGIDGLLVSPQHIFVHPGGEQILLRKEYWSFGGGESGIKALLGMMDRAAAKLTGSEGAPTPPADGQPPAAPTQPTAPPASDPGAAGAPDAAQEAARTEWIQRMLTQVLEGDEEARQLACGALVKHDREGDCVDPLLLLIPTCEKEVPILVDIVRALGVPQLERAVEPLTRTLKHKDRLVRGNAAVTLEYIGSPTAVKPLRARAAKEKDEAVANHLFRALGRCGAADSKTRGVLLKRADGAKTEFAALGPLIGLAYFEQDKKARRAVEKLLAKLGIPGGGRRGGGWRNGLKRAITAWTLSEIGDERSGTFIREKLLKQLKNAQGPFSGALTRFYRAVAEKCEGHAEALDAIQAGVNRTMEFLRGEQTLSDEMRQGRDTTKFEPKGEWIGSGS